MSTSATAIMAIDCFIVIFSTSCCFKKLLTSDRRLDGE